MTTIQATEATIRATGAALGRAKLFDDRITDSDAGRIAAWAEALQPHELSPAEIMGAVTGYYQANDGSRSIQVADIIRLGRAARRDRAEVEKGHALPTGRLDTRGNPVEAAYDIRDAITRKCPRCGSLPDQYCYSPITGDTLKIPCLPRISGKRLLGAMPL